MNERFWKKVDKNGPVPVHRPELGPCWIWTASLDGHGYGHIWWEGRLQTAARVALKLKGIVLKLGECALHHCDNPPCVRHLFVGTKKTNSDDMKRRGRERKAMGDASPSRLHPESRPRGESHTSAKLTTSLVNYLRTTKGRTKAFAICLGVTVSTIKRVRNGRTWKAA